MQGYLWEAREAHALLALQLAKKKQPALLCKLYDKALPSPMEPTPAPEPSPPLLLMIGTNGGQVALGYAPQGVVPGMEAFMPREVKALPAAPQKERSNGKSKSRPR